MNDREQIAATLRRVVSTVLGVDVEALTEETAFEADLGAKSGNLTMIITQLEDEFDVEIPYLDVKRARTVGGVIDLLVELCEE